MVVTKTPMTTVYKQVGFSTREVFLHFLKWVNKEFHMDNYHKADWGLYKTNYSNIPVNSSDERQHNKGINHKDNSITVSGNKNTELFLICNCFGDCFNCKGIWKF